MLCIKCGWVKDGRRWARHPGPFDAPSAGLLRDAPGDASLDRSEEGRLHLTKSKRPHIKYAPSPNRLYRRDLRADAHRSQTSDRHPFHSVAERDGLKVGADGTGNAKGSGCDIRRRDVDDGNANTRFRQSRDAVLQRTDRPNAWEIAHRDWRRSSANSIEHLRPTQGKVIRRMVEHRANR